MQTGQEELKSTNEELQSTNEELQSTNEELTTSKEEMQSLNEELQTVNAELQSKVDDFSRVNNDMKNLLNSTDIATLFLDKDLNIRRYTNQATKIFKLIKGDVGRPFTDLVSDLIYPGLAEDSLEVLRTLVFIEKQIPTKDERWFSIRIMPYRTYDDRIDGLVITFVNLFNLKQMEVKLYETEKINSLLLNASSDVIIKLSADCKILEYNHEAEKFFDKKRGDALTQNYIEMFVPEPERKKTEKYINKILKEGLDCKFKMQVIAAAGKKPVVEWSVTVLLNNQKRATGMIIITNKITIS
jgi:two-component system CheB/CheR fusion protein